MLGLAGLPATVGFIGKLYLIEALVEGDYTWLAVFIAVGTMISLAYYLRVVAAMWMRPRGPAGAAPAIAGASPEADPIDPEAGRRLYLVAPALLAAAAVVFFGVIPQPLVEFAEHAGASLLLTSRRRRRGGSSSPHRSRRPRLPVARASSGMDPPFGATRREGA